MKGVSETPEQGAENREEARSLFFLSVTPARRYPEALFLYPRTNKKQDFLCGRGDCQAQSPEAHPHPDPTLPTLLLESPPEPRSTAQRWQEAGWQAGALCPMITAWHSPHLGWRRHGISDNLIGTPGESGFISPPPPPQDF